MCGGGVENNKRRRSHIGKCGRCRGHYVSIAYDQAYKPLINLDGCHSTRRLCRSNMNDYMFYKYVDMDQSYCTAEGSDRRAAQMLAES